MNNLPGAVIQFPNLKDYQVISFDVFDTSVFRLVFEPRDVFLLIEEELVKKYCQVFIGFSDLRFQAELETVSKVWKRDRSAEVTLDQIYQTLGLINPIFQSYIEEIKAIELQLEKSLIVPSYPVLSFFKIAKSLGKKVIFVSDTYLPKPHIIYILQNAGYDHYEKLFVSCEIGTNKASGKLFDRVIQEMNVEPKQILHIGDNPNSDIKKAAAKGISVYQLPYPAALLNSSRYNTQKYKQYHFRKTVSESLLCGLQKNYLINGSHIKTDRQTSSYDIGYQILGPLCYGFIHWMIQHAQQNNIKHLYFIAREGWFLKKIFDQVNQVKKTEIESHYFYGSRIALFYPLMTKPVGKYLCNFLIAKKPKKVKNYLEQVGLNMSEIRLKEFGFNTDEDMINPIKNSQDRERLEALFDAETEQLEKLAQEEKANYLEYLQQEGILSIDKIGLVDSGWFGNGQNKLQQFITLSNPDANLFGFYLALHRKAQKNFNNTSSGYGYLHHFDDCNNDIQSFLEIARIIEVLLSAPAESLRRFTKKDGTIYPVFVKNNKSCKLHPIVEEIHAGAVEFVRDFLNVPTQQLPTISSDYAANLLNKFIEYPTEEEAYNIGALPYDINILAAENDPKFAFPDINLMDLIKNPLALNIDLEKTLWRSAYYHNHSSAIIKFLLRYTQRYFIVKNPKLSRIYSVLRYAYKKSIGRLKSSTKLTR